MKALVGAIVFIFAAMNVPPPQITLVKNEWSPLSQAQFFHATTGAAAPQLTHVKLKYDDTFLYITFECTQNPFVAQNTYTQHNSEMWNQEVFELFIAEGTSLPTRYLELEINPNNALFVGWIDNPTGKTPAKLTFVPYQEAGIQHQVKTQADSWAGQLQVPWALLGGQKPAYRLNFYRIVSRQSQDDPAWKCSPDNSDFLCWNSPLSGNMPSFHRPSSFGILQLK
jgi:Carbohydrate family 9 binding domain-like